MNRTMEIPDLKALNGQQSQPLRRLSRSIGTDAQADNLLAGQAG